MKPIVQQLDDHFHPKPQPTYFAGAVEQVGFELEPSLSPVADEVVPQRDDDLLKRLAALHPNDDETRKLVHRIFSRAIALLDELSTAEHACNKERLASLRSAHVDVRAQGRELLGQISKLQTKAGRILAEFNSDNKTKHLAGAYLRQTQESRKHISRWASDEEISEADAAIAEAREQLRVATEQASGTTTNYNNVQFQITELQRELDKLALDESRLRGELSGKAYVDPEFLLTKVPGI